MSNNSAEQVASLLHALKWATEYVCLFTGDGAGVTGVQQGHDRDRFIDDETGDFCPENLRAYLLEVIDKAEGGPYGPGDRVILWGLRGGEVIQKTETRYKVRWEHTSEQGDQYSWCNARELERL